MKKWLIGLGLLLTVPGAVLAVGVAQSGIDWDASTITVELTIPDPNTNDHPAFECFGETGGNSITKFLSDPEVNIDQSTGEIDISENNNCFRQAGAYTVIITLKDNAGNIADPEEFTFNIKPSDPDPIESELENINNCFDLHANNDESCELTLKIKDRFRNPVTQIDTNTSNTTISVGNVGSALNFNEVDANVGIGFLDGLRSNGSVLSNLILDVTNGTVESFPITALAPSIIKVGDYLARFLAWPVSLPFELPKIKPDGDVDSISSPTMLDVTKGLQFKNLFSLRPDDLLDFYWGIPQDLSLILEEFIPHNASSPRMGTLQDASDWSFGIPQLPDPDPVPPNPLPHEFDFLLNEPADPDDIEIEIISVSNDEPGLATKVEYTISGVNISHPAGGIGAELLPDGESEDTLIGYNPGSIEFRQIGVDIESGVLGDPTRMFLQTTGEDITRIGGVSAQDIREQITENTFRLIRGASDIKTGLFTFDDTNFIDEFVDTNVIVVENNVTMSGTFPPGKNTLIILNGNLLITGDLAYMSNNDSFGIILVNDTTTIPPLTGNIFVHPNVQKFTGSYFADGGLMTNNKNELPGMNHESENTNQLLLVGSLFSRNTIGGSMILSDNNEYPTPWGTTPDHNEALQHDLHFVRRYFPTGGTCVGSPCDLNSNAFVVRSDNKASTLPPPGFETFGAIKR